MTQVSLESDHARARTRNRVEARTSALTAQASIRVTPPMNGCSAVGTSTLPSAFW